MTQDRQQYDVVVIGAGPAGLAGVWVAGNVTELTAQVGASAAAGAAAGAALNGDLVTEDTGLALDAVRAGAAGGVAPVAPSADAR